MKAMRNTIHAAICALSVLLAPALAAQEQAAVPEPPEVKDSEADQGGRSDAQPRTTVRQHEAFGQKITEYERGGKVFLMEVKPRVGPTQYWDDPDGDGQFQNSTSDNIDENINLPKWRLGGW